MSIAGAAWAAELPQTESGVFQVPRGVHLLSVGGRSVLYSQARQQIFQLNDTADLIWRGLAGGETPDQVAEALQGLGLDRTQALSFVGETARTWVLGGQLLPAAVVSALGAGPTALRTLALDEMAVELAFHGDAAHEACDAVFAQFYGPLGRPPRRLDVVEDDGLAFLCLDGEPYGVARSEGLTALVKAALTEIYLHAVEGAFLAHGALLARGDATMFLSGQPGAGKTTLTLALAAAGWAYGGDDIVRIDPDGQVRGAPFAAAVKSGAWPLLRSRWPALEELPTAIRGDGQQVRYLLPENRLERGPRALDLVLLLARQEGAAARLEPVEPLEALAEILDSAYAARWRLDAEALAVLARRLEAAACRRLVYSDLSEAVAAIDELAPCLG